MNQPPRIPDPGPVTVAIWHRDPCGPAQATRLSPAAARLARPALAALIAATRCEEPGARAVIDHILEIPPGQAEAILPEHSLPLEPELVEDEEDEQALPPPVADPATGAVRVISRRCHTCIYRRSMRAVLGPSVPALIDEARRSGGFVVCHETLPAWQGGHARILAAICHGYASRYPDTFALRVARAIGRIEPVDPPQSADRSE